MTNRMKTGIEGLDAILGGGFLRHNSVLFKGAPGAGKTSLGIQILLHGIREENEGAVICSFEQFPQQLQRDMAAFGWDLQALEAQNRLRVVYLRPDDLVSPKGSSHPTLASRTIELADEVGARRLLLDSVSHFNRVTGDPVQCRTAVLEFVNAVKAHGITPMLTSEMPGIGAREYSFEEYLVDEVVLLHHDPLSSGASSRRDIEVTKSRGHAHAPGRHPFRFGDRGIEVFPHIPPQPFAADELAGADRTPVTSGVSGVDELLGGGYPRGSASIVAGMSGCFKTTLACAFLAAGARAGERGLLISFQETPHHLLGALARRGVDLDKAVAEGDVAIRNYVPESNCLEEIFADLCHALDESAPRRIVIDSLDDLQRTAGDTERAKQYLGMFLARLARARATTLLTQRLSTPPGADPLAGIPYADMTDTVIYLGNVEIESEMHKVIAVPKSRSARAQSALREIVCRETGLHVSQKFHGLSGILQGAAHGRYKKTVENIFQPLYFIRDFAAMGSGDAASDEQRRVILADIGNQIRALDETLKEYFGFDPEETRKR